MSANTSTLIRCLSLSTLLILVAACSDSSSQSPTAPGPSPLVLQSASVSIDGQNVTNGTWNHQGHAAASTRFEARLHQDGMPVTGQWVYVDFDRPQGMGMMQHNGRFQLYDDGTHGDHVPGDGLYCLEDFDMHYGFHHGDAPHGEYHYEYFGEDHQGHHSNHFAVTVQVGG